LTWGLNLEYPFAGFSAPAYSHGLISVVEWQAQSHNVKISKEAEYALSQTGATFLG
jgi:hypothetical protein